MTQSFETRSNPAHLEDGYFYAGDGAQLPLRSWTSGNKIKAVIVAVHGFNDYSRAFKMPGEYMAEYGIALYAYDQRGFGENLFSGVWPGRDNLIHDLSDFLSAVKNLHPATPVYVMGESMGGAVVIIASSENLLQKADGIILVAPAVWGGDSMNGFYRGVLKFMNRFFPGAKLTGKSVGVQASDNIEMLRELGRDPLFIKETRVDAIAGIVSLMDEAYTKSHHLKNPAILLYGSKDQVIPMKPVKKFVAGLSQNEKVVWYDEGWHMLLRDLQREKVYKDIINWVGEQKK